MKIIIATLVWLLLLEMSVAEAPEQLALRLLGARTGNWIGDYQGKDGTTGQLKQSFEWTPGRAFLLGRENLWINDFALRKFATSMTKIDRETGQIRSWIFSSNGEVRVKEIKITQKGSQYHLTHTQAVQELAAPNPEGVGVVVVVCSRDGMPISMSASDGTSTLWEVSNIRRAK